MPPGPATLRGWLRHERLPRVQVGDGPLLDAGQLQAANPALRQAPLRPAPRQRNPPPTPQDLEDFGELDPKLRAVLRSFGTPAG